MSQITDEQSKFFSDLADAIKRETWDKSTAGITEHGGGNLWDVPVLTLLEEASKEFIDGYVYTYTAIHTLKFLLSDPVIAKRAKELLK